MAKRSAHRAMPSLLNRSTAKEEYSVINITSEEFVIGRALKSSFVIPDVTLSRRHCTFRYDDEQWNVTDESTTGVCVNGGRLEKGLPMKLKSGDVIQLGCNSKWVFTFTFQENHQSTGDGSSEVKKVKLDSNELVGSETLSELESQLAAKNADFGKSLKLLIENDATKRINEQIRQAQQRQAEIEKEKEDIQQIFEDNMKKINQRLNPEDPACNQHGRMNEEDIEKINMEKMELRHKLDEKLTELHEKLEDTISREQAMKQEKENFLQKLKKERAEFEQRILKEQELLKQQLTYAQKLTEKINTERAKVHAALLERDQQLQTLKISTSKEKSALKKQLKELKARLAEKEKQEEDDKRRLQEETKRVQMLEEEKKKQKEHSEAVMEHLLRDINEREEAAKLRLKETLKNLQHDKIAIENEIKEKSEAKEDVGKLTEELEKVKQNLLIVDQKREMLEKELKEAINSASENTLQAREEILHNFGELMETELQCSICNELFLAATTLTCNHTFCKFCITEWRKKKNQCPVCRKRISAEYRSLPLDNFISKMVENLSDDMKKRREELKAEREASEKKKKNEKEKKERVRTGRHNQQRRERSEPLLTPQPTSSSSSSSSLQSVEIVYVSDSSVTSDDDDFSSSNYDSSDSSYAEGVPGSFYGGHGNCFHCGRRGHWSNGCPDRY